MPELKYAKVYDPVGRCIYCGRSDFDLTREHIIPFALGGQLILPDASCRGCAKIINETFENACLRKMFGQLRLRRNFPTRNPKQRPKTLPMHVVIGDRAETIQTPVPYRPDGTVMFAFPVPGIISGITPDQAATIPIPAIWFHGKRGNKARQWAKNREATRHGGIASFNPELFSKMIGKIAHAFAVAELGMNGFVPFLPKALIGEEPWKLGYYVGGFPDEVPRSEYINEIGLRLVDDNAGKPYHAVQIRIFGDAGAPVYQVVVGAPLYAAITASTQNQ